MVPKKIQWQLLISSFQHFPRLNLMLLMLSLDLLSGCTSARQNYSWTSWTKDVDSPGIQYRYLCSGEQFNGSKFTKWEVEVYNDYPAPVALTLAIIEEATGNHGSEQKTVAIPPASLKTITFFNSTINCQQIGQIAFLEVQILP